MENLSIGAEHSRIFLAIYRFQIRFQFRLVFVFVFAFDWDAALNLTLFAECLWQTEFVVVAVVLIVVIILLFIVIIIIIILIFLINLTRSRLLRNSSALPNARRQNAQTICWDMPRTATATATSALALRLLRSGFDWIRQAIFPTVPFRAVVACLPVGCCVSAVVSFFLWLPAANFASNRN